tara:strand:- start:128 stop:655 length:528 start_codon:yes stop_codon:yes gene_type:complete
MNITKIYGYLSLFLIYSCGIYSFNGSSISNEVKTFQINYFTNKAENIQPNLSSLITEKLKDRFIEQTNLNITENNGHLFFEGYINKYEIKPIGINADEIATQNRLTISINVKFINEFENEKNFEKTFTRYKDYESSYNLTDVDPENSSNTIEESLILFITNELTEDVFNEAVMNW